MIRRNLIASIVAAPLAGALALLPLSGAQAYSGAEATHLEQTTPLTSAPAYGYNPVGGAVAGAALGVIGAIAGATSCYTWDYNGCYSYPYGYGYGWPSYGYSGPYYSHGWGHGHWRGHYAAASRFKGGSRMVAHAGGERRVR